MPKNSFSSAISACEKCGQWRTALDLLDQMVRISGIADDCFPLCPLNWNAVFKSRCDEFVVMKLRWMCLFCFRPRLMMLVLQKKEGTGQTAIAYNAAISACEKGLVPHKALEIFEQMKREGVRPTVVTYSALISAAEKGQQWKLALEVLEEMKAAGHGANVIAYSAAISALSKGQMWHKALELFREIEASGGKPSIVTYNATMTALEKGLQWERALDLFDEMKMKNMPVTVVSYGSAISACEKGLQYRQCLEYLDEMTEMGIKKNVIIFGAAMSCMEKSCRADIAFQLMERMKLEDVSPNVHIYNSAISACARCNLWEKGYELFKEMDDVRVARDVVTYNAVLDAVCPQVQLGRKLFKEGVDKGFYARVSRLGTQWLELDLHFLSLGGGEIALGWWFEECLVPYLINTSKLEAVQSISIVTGYGKTRSRGARMNDDGMRLRVRAMLKYMEIQETPQPNKGRIHIDKEALIEVVKRNRGRILFDLEGYTKFKEEETTANKFPDVEQKVRPRFRPARPGEGPHGTFVRIGEPVPPYNPNESLEDSYRESPPRRPDVSFPSDRQDNRRSSSYAPHGNERTSDRGYDRSSQSWNQDPRVNSRDPRDVDDGKRGQNGSQGVYRVPEGVRSGGADFNDRRRHENDNGDRRSGAWNNDDRRSSQTDFEDRRGNAQDWGPRSSNSDSRGSRHDRDSSFYGDDRRGSSFERASGRSRGPPDQESIFSDRNPERDTRSSYGRQPDTDSFRSGRAENDRYSGTNRRPGSNDLPPNFRAVRDDPEVQAAYKDDNDSYGGGKKRPFDDYQKHQASSRGYDIEPAYTKRRSS